ncbi:serine--tRNA ligase [Tumebacillus permanentifrigoris]|uniref:Serine--tRNA ligase n=1 Tax=Tumebacillus permanentifrigoris TaxID=378543 RepID=A0A316D6J8_9BACL|nr:serine--tRNA ligase [Tumebacillus permanentifrigoris]PWK08461.1 seryl-tRNA synthetase [Tumebacillus permanentifrigoris]
MLDIRYIRENPDVVQTVAQQKGIEVSITDLLALDGKRRALLQEVEGLRKQRNDLSQSIPRLAKDGNQDEVEQIKELVRGINANLTTQEALLQDVEQQWSTLLLRVPNIISPDTPIGASDEENVELRQIGELPQFDFAIQDHVTLGETYDLFDLPRGAKVAGTRQYYLKGIGLYLHRAVQQLAIDLLTERGFTVMDVPMMVREDVMTNTGFFPLGREQTYELGRDNAWLVGTSEVPLVSYHAGEVVDVNQPIRFAGVSNCFRREAGAAGRDTRGLYRVHQFAKVEQVVICKNDPAVSEAILQEITKNAEDLLQLLELPYRVVAVCTGDIGQGVYKKYDIETWMPSRENYGETQSASNLLEFQARRSNIRYRDENGQLQYCHTLNNTAVATPRILIPLLENHQRADGSIYIPQALRKYLNGLEEIKPGANVFG